VRNNDLANYYCAGDVFVLSSEKESFGVANFKAMACGIPVVTTEVMGIKEVVRDGREGVIVPPREIYSRK